MAARRKGDSLSTVLNNLNLQLKKQREVSHAGLLAGGYLVLRGAQLLVPVDTGHLKNSGYVRDLGEGKGVEIGFTASYAIYVHENMEAYHAVGQAKFLEQSLKDNHAQILKLAASGG